jgi:large subunit ribosomal protein L19
VIARGGCGLRAWCIVRNVIDGQGIEFRYELYSPTIRLIEVIKLEKRLDDELYYLRDAPKVSATLLYLKTISKLLTLAQVYSTFPQNMETEFLPDQEPVPVNDVIIPIEDGKRLHRNWHLYTERLEGFSMDGRLKYESRFADFFYL